VRDPLARIWLPTHGGRTYICAVDNMLNITRDQDNHTDCKSAHCHGHRTERPIAQQLIFPNTTTNSCGLDVGGSMPSNGASEIFWQWSPSEEVLQFCRAASSSGRSEAFGAFSARAVGAIVLLSGIVLREIR
jgi:hypothetical protein